MKSINQSFYRAAHLHVWIEILLQAIEKFGRYIGCVKGYGRKTVTIRERQTCTFLQGMILHNDHSPRIGMGPANTRKHVFKISRARQVPLLANLRPSLRTCARCMFRSPAGIAKELRFSGNSFQVRIASRKLSSFQECRVHRDPTILSCANISERVHQFWFTHRIQHYARCIKPSSW